MPAASACGVAVNGHHHGLAHLLVGKYALVAVEQHRVGAQLRQRRHLRLALDLLIRQRPHQIHGLVVIEGRRFFGRVGKIEIQFTGAGEAAVITFVGRQREAFVRRIGPGHIGAVGHQCRRIRPPALRALLAGFLRRGRLRSTAASRSVVTTSSRRGSVAGDVHTSVKNQS